MATSRDDETSGSAPAPDEVSREASERVRRALREHFSGKRDSRRSVMLLEVEVGGEFESFQGLAVDISRSGLLLRIMDPCFTRIEGEPSLVRYSEMVKSRFGDGPSIRFRGTLVQVKAEIVRVSTFSTTEPALTLVGCSFRRALTVDECAQIGIDPGLESSQGI